MSDKTGDGGASQRVRFHYIKSHQFRVVHVDGAIGGITPRGLLHIALYSERQPIPQIVEHDLSPEGRLSSEAATQEGRQGIVRDLDVDLIMTRETAIEIRDWLTNRLDELNKIIASQSADQASLRKNRNK
jgi:hypothetical protein